MAALLKRAAQNVTRGGLLTAGPSDFPDLMKSAETGQPHS